MSVARRIRLDLAYDGTDFAGWQFQPGRRTVQGVLEEVLGRLVQNGEPVGVRGAGRTDAGVHALHQVAHADVCTRLHDARLEYALSRLMPADLRVRRVHTVPPEFHARNHAVSKTYGYVLDLSMQGDPFLARYALHHRRPLDAAGMRMALERLLGRHDWTAFTGAGCTVADRVRTLAEARYEISPGQARFTFTADGFLRYMVRNLVGTLLLVGRGALAPERVEAILAGRDRTRAGPTAPAHGLRLERVSYEGSSLDIGHSPPSVTT